MMGNKSFVYRFADIEVREREFSLIKSGEALPVEPKAFRVLLFLLRNPQKLITKDELLNAVWGDTVVSENSLARSIALLRRLLGDDMRSPRYIETVATVGYRFLGNVEVVEDPTFVPVAPDLPGTGESRVAKSADLALPVENEPAARRSSRAALVVGAVVAILLAIGVWYLTWPLPPPRVTQYVQITHDGNIGSIAGNDGSRIYFNMSPWGPIAQVGVSGGEIVTIPIAAKRALVSGVSADGANLLIWSWNPPELWTMGTVGGSPRFIQKNTSFILPAWSQDTKYIAYADSNGNVYTMRSDGTDIRKLATFKSYVTDIAWSPDGGRIRLTVNSSLWEITSTGGNPHPLLPEWKGPVGQCCGQWTPDGDFFMFLAGGNSTAGPAVGGFEQIWALDERHSLFHRVPRAPVHLTIGPIHWATPVPSRDGGRIYAVGTIPRGELVRLDPKSKQLLPFLGGISEEFVAYSKDGAQIAYVTYPDGILWRAKADGTDRVQLTSPPTYPRLCRWSPDGTQILFSDTRSASRFGLYTVSAQGGMPRLLLPDDDGQGEIDGYWSPDGHKIVYQVDAHHSLRILDLDTGKVNQVPDSDGLWSPRWSPDGRYIAAMATLPPVTIKLFDLQTQHWSTLTENTGPWGYPTWSHNGRFIYALNDRGKWSIQRISVPDGKIDLVVDLSDVHLIGAVGFWFGLDPNDTPLLLRNNGTRDIYALTLEVK
jgi:DNA-binding winged helix-turn-helix (wHTH) protein/Tol biopolymer transport system component